MWSLGVCLFAMLSGFFPLDEATAADWRFPRLAQAQAKAAGRSSTTKTVYAWYKRSTEHLTPEVIHLLDSLLTINAEKRLTIEQLRAHPWVKGQKFGGVDLADQGSYNAGAEVLAGGEDGPMYRGFSAGEFEEQGDAYMEDDDMPVYRSLGGGMGDAAPPAPVTLTRQKACINLLEPEAFETMAFA